MELFNNVLTFINKFRQRKKISNNNPIEIYSNFQAYLNLVDKEDEAYNNVCLAVELCDNAIKISKQRIILTKKQKEYINILEGLDCYQQLSEEDTEYLKELVEKFVSLTKEKNVLRYQIVDFDKSLDKLIDLEDEAPYAINQMADAEQQQRLLKQDIGYLQGEKEELEEERENLKFGLIFIYRFTIAMVLIFGITVMLLVLLNIFQQKVVFFPLTIICILLIFIVSLIFIFRRKISFELKYNAKKQCKAVGLLNKKIVVYSYYTNFLKYVYNKYNVKSSEALRNNLNEYGHYKHITSRYDSIRNIMYQTQKMLEEFLIEKNIKDINASIERFAQTIDIDDKIQYCKEITDKKAQVEQELLELDNRHEVIWDELTRLNLEDATENHIIESIIKTYLDEAGRLVFDVEDVDKEEEIL